MKATIFFILLLGSALIRSDGHAEAVFHGEGFVAEFRSQPAEHGVRYNNEGGFFEQTFYSAVDERSSYWVREVVGTSRLSNDMCTGDEREILERFLDISSRKDVTTNEWIVFHSADGSTHTAKLLRSIGNGEPPETFITELHITRECRVFAITVLGTDRTAVEERFDEFSRSFAFEGSLE